MAGYGLYIHMPDWAASTISQECNVNYKIWLRT